MKNHSDGHCGRQPALAAASLAALGIVFGDIGTSPIYAFRACFNAEQHGAPISAENLVGAASLVIWSLILVVSLKYLFIILRLDNRGEGGILALSALIRSGARRLGGSDPKTVLFLGLAGAALIYADGMLTPAISVLSAVEGLSVSAPVVSDWILPICVGVLIGLFAIQRFGTGRVGVIFGPVLLLWFFVIGALGLRMALKHPAIFGAISPHAALMFMIHEWHHAFPLLASVFLAVTGGEALYADLGHFGVKPIRAAWFTVVFPGLALNYLGQAALLTEDPAAIENPFFKLAPEALRLPLTILATCAAVIASQALISGAFSLTTQAVQLGVLPRVRIRYTSEHSAGQVYVPSVNKLLAIACILLVLWKKESTKLEAAYGIAIALTMAITSLLFYSAAIAVWGWSKVKALAMTSAFMAVDGAFLAANTHKIVDGGWLPLVAGGAIFAIMMTWLWGRARLYARLSREALPVAALLTDLKRGSIHRVHGTAVYMSGRGDTVPTALLHNLKHNQVLHEKVVLLHVHTLDQPYVNPREAAEHFDLGEGMHRVNLNFGFADTPDVPDALKNRLPDEVKFNPGKATYFLGRESYGVGKNASALDRIRLALFAVMARNASPATAYFRLPPGRVVELGAQITL
ncbi:potassium transporter Kup [Haloferula sp. BvORR071]|uniref:potassium transporter Kup n=1 Tax=Haloferula sp. BvORR071 TaxID=1396141 RepID=UPI0005509DC0|nr:potassium transporter Kup [Haloferula sp. BvORR071]